MVPDPMGLVIVFFLGIANFAAHKAVLECGHPLMAQLPRYMHLLGGRLSLLVEFVMLAGAMFMVASGSIGWALGYLVYSLANGFSAWLILSNRL